MRVEAKAIQDYFKAQWTYNVPVAYDNELFTPVSGSPFIRFNIVASTGAQVSLGSPSLSRNRGYVHCTTFAPIGEGLERLNWVSDKIIAILGKKSINNVTLEHAYPVASGYAQEDGWYCYSVTVPFWFELVS